MLVPLTSSLYVPGRITDPEHVVVDIGTGYYVKKVSCGTSATVNTGTRSLTIRRWDFGRNYVDIDSPDRKPSRYIRTRSSLCRRTSTSCKQRSSENRTTFRVAWGSCR